MTETELMTAIRAECGRLHLLALHISDTRGSWTHGFPDLLIAGPHGLLFRECKSWRGTLSPDQTAWKYMLLAAGADWGLWRPSDWDNGRIHAQLEWIA